MWTTRGTYQGISTFQLGAPTCHLAGTEMFVGHLLDPRLQCILNHKWLDSLPHKPAARCKVALLPQKAAVWSEVAPARDHK